MPKAVHPLTQPLPDRPHISERWTHQRDGLTPVLCVWLCFVSSSGCSGTKEKGLYEGPRPHKKPLNVVGPDGPVLE